MKRVVAIVIDSGGIGALRRLRRATATRRAPIRSVTSRSDLVRCDLPHLERLGTRPLTRDRRRCGGRATAGARRASARAQPRQRYDHRTLGDDGHRDASPFPTYPHGFPPEIVAEFTRIAGKAPLGNMTASGTEIIEALGPEHLAGGRPILYTSADSVFQIAAHEEIVPPGVLYEWCEPACAMLCSLPIT